MPFAIVVQGQLWGEAGKINPAQLHGAFFTLLTDPQLRQEAHEMAGRKVRCPGCQKPLRIPGSGSEKGASAVAAKASTKPAKAKSSSAGVDEEAALLKYEKVQQRKAQSAETEAAYREEQNKLTESYDQIAGRTPAKDKKKGELAGSSVKKVTIFTKLDDAWGVVFGTLLAKYMKIGRASCRERG